MSKLKALLGIAALAAAVGCSTGDTSDAESQTQNATKVSGVSKSDREGYLAAAKIWSAEDFAKLPQKDLLIGRGGKDSFLPTRNADGTLTYPEITCKFVEPEREHELGGKSPKFQCGACAEGCNVDKTLKVKFGQNHDDNGEVYAEVMATRMLWALGYKTDDVYPVRVNCINCPEDPWAVYEDFTPGAGARATRRYTTALIERKYEGPKIEESGWPDDKDGQGFAYEDVDKARRRQPGKGAPDPEWSAFKLLASFIKHADNKAANQRLVCSPDAVTEDGRCESPFLMIQDMGATFGGAGQLFGSIGSDTKARLDDWHDSPVWKDRKLCKASLFTFFSLFDPVVTEEGRVFLVNLLNQLSDQNLRDIFTASRIVERREVVKVNGPKHEATVEDWIHVYREKVAELGKPCFR